jgi:polygalacturonase
MPVNVQTRREFLARWAAGAVLSRSAFAAEDPWSRLPAILSRIQPPSFPKRDFDVTRFGAVRGGGKDSTDAFRRAILACSQAGGGRVVVPAGDFLTGAVHLKSGVNLYVSEGAVVRFSRDPSQYLPVVFTRWEGIECMNYSPFVYAFGQENIAITGGGTLDGQSDCTHWWPWKARTNCGWKKGDPNQDKARKALVDMAERDVPVPERVFGEGACLRPMFIQPYKCRNILIEGVTIRNSPMWEIHPALCRNVTVQRVTVISHGPNNDGCNPESSTDVLIKDCHFDTGDDCIAIKSGRNRDGRRVAVPCENIVIQGCEMKDGHGGVTIGSEVSGDVRNVFAEDCRMDSPNLDRVLRLKTNSVRGGVIENIYMRNVTVGQVSSAAVEADLFYEEGDSGQFKPVVRNIEVRNLRCAKSKQAVALRGYASAPIQSVRLEHCTFDKVDEPNLVENVKGLVLVDVTINGVRAN